MIIFNENPKFGTGCREGTSRKIHIRHWLNLTAGIKIAFFLLCFILLIFPLEVFSQFINEKALDMLEGKPSPESEQTEGESAKITVQTVEFADIDFMDPFEPQIFRSKKKKPEVAGAIELKEQKISELFSLSIQGVIWNSDIPVVIINNQVLKKGEYLSVKEEDATEKVTILDIEKDEVTVGYRGLVEKLSSPASSELKISEAKIKEEMNE